MFQKTQFSMVFQYCNEMKMVQMPSKVLSNAVPYQLNNESARNGLCNMHLLQLVLWTVVHKLYMTKNESSACENDCSDW